MQRIGLGLVRAQATPRHLASAVLTLMDNGAVLALLAASFAPRALALRHDGQRAVAMGFGRLAGAAHNRSRVGAVHNRSRARRARLVGTASDATFLRDASVFAVLGVFSTDTNASHDLRQAHRQTWISKPLHSSIHVRFVMRGINASALAISESSAYRDVVFVNASASADRNVGPVLSLSLWLAHAVAAWPEATLIGKADDDVWLDLAGIAHHLRSSLAATAINATQSLPLLYWGIMETYSWNEELRRPQQGSFRYKYGMAEEHCKKDCRAANCGGFNRAKGNQALTGPFMFAKGPLFFMSYDLARQLDASPWFQRDVESTVEIGSAMYAANNHTKLKRPYEDVLTGRALARVAQGQELVSVHAGTVFFNEPWGTYAPMRRSVLVVHDKMKHPTRIRFVDQWAENHHCTGQMLQMNCGPKRFVSCSGARWRRCLYVHNQSSCSSAIVRKSWRRTPPNATL